MAGYENIKDKGFDNRSTGELREISSKGGKLSGEARRRKADFRKSLNLLLATKIDHPDITPILETLGIESTIENTMLMAQIKEAMLGDTTAARFIAQYSGQSDKPDEDIRNKDADTELKEARRRDITGENESHEAVDKLDEILKEMRDNAVKQQAE